MKKVTLLLTVGVLLLAGCTDFKNIQISELTDKQRQEKSSKITDDENNLLQGYLKRKADEAVTVQEAILLQKTWEEAQIEQARIEKEKLEAKRKEKLEAESIVKDRIKLVNSLISINVKEKGTQEFSVRRKITPFNVFFFEATNKSDKNIIKYRAIVSVKDKNGKTLDKAIVDKATPIQAGSVIKDSFAIQSSRLDLDEVKINNSDISELVFKFDFNLIEFDDGTKMEILLSE